MKHLTTFVLGFLLFSFFLFSKTTVLSQDNSLTIVDSTQIIVKYKNGQSIDDLLQQIKEKKQTSREGILSAIKVVFQSLVLRINGGETLESKLYRLTDAEQRAKVVSKNKLFSDDPSLKNFYQMKLDQPAEACEAVSIFRNLPEVEFAELNYLSLNEEYK